MTVREQEERQTATEVVDGVVVDFMLVGECLDVAAQDLVLHLEEDGRFAARSRAIIPNEVTRLLGLEPGQRDIALSLHDEVIFRDTLSLSPGLNRLIYDCHEFPSFNLQVVDEDGVAVAQAEFLLQARHARGHPPIRLVADDDGRAFVSTLLPHAEYVVECDSRAHSQVEKAGFVFSAAAEDRLTTDVSFTLNPSRVVSGHLVNSAGKPVIEGEVWLGEGRDARRTTTNGLGFFEFNDASSGELRLRAEAKHHAPMTTHVPSREGNESIIIELAEPAFITGVARAEGTALHKRVRLYAAALDKRAASQDFAFEVMTDGAFTLGPMPQGRYRVHDLHDPAFSVLASTGDHLELDLAPWGTRSMTLHLTSPDGSPITASAFALISVGDDAMHKPQVAITKAGVATIGWRAVETHADIELVVRGYESLTLWDVDGTAESVKEITLYPPDPVVISLAASDGELLENAQVIVDWLKDGITRFGPGPFFDTTSVGFPNGSHWRQRLTVDSAGNALIDPAGREDLQLTFVCPGYFSERRVVSGNERRVHVVLEPFVPRRSQ